MRGDHAELATRPLFEGVETGLEVTDLGGELPIALGKLIVFASLRRNGLFQAIELAYATLGEPNPVLQEENDEC